MSRRIEEGSGLRHSCSRSCKEINVNGFNDIEILCGDTKWRPARLNRTSMSKSLSILTASPNKKIYCIKLANSHMFRSLSNRDDSGLGSGLDISSWLRFRGAMVSAKAPARAGNRESAITAGGCSCSVQIRFEKVEH